MQVLLNPRLTNTAYGAISIAYSNMQIVGGMFVNNSNSIAGALDINSDSSVLIDSCSFQQNQATSAGAIRVWILFRLRQWQVVIAGNATFHRYQLASHETK